MHSAVVEKYLVNTHLFEPTLRFISRLLFLDDSKSRAVFFPPMMYSFSTPNADTFRKVDAIFSMSVGFSRTQIKYRFRKCFISLILSLTVIVFKLYQVKRQFRWYIYLGEYRYEQMKWLNWLSKNAAGLGFEPRYSDPKSDVLPLNDPAIMRKREYCTKFILFLPGGRQGEEVM